MSELSYFNAAVIAIVEGLTEYLPVSSTGHMILVGKAISFEGEFATTFEIVIQLGAIAAVVVLYWRKFFALLKPDPENSLSGFPGMLRFALSCAPAAAVGLVAGKIIKAQLFNPTSVALALIVGGVALILVERKAPGKVTSRVEEITLVTALLVGCFQILALWPGFSRSGSMIIGGLLLGLSRTAAAEYSFLIAVPMMMMATGHELWEARETLSTDGISLLLFGSGIAFVVALLAIKGFIGLLRRFSMAPFGVYRIVLGITVLYLINTWEVSAPTAAPETQEQQIVETTGS